MTTPRAYGSAKRRPTKLGREVSAKPCAALRPLPLFHLWIAIGFTWVGGLLPGELYARAEIQASTGAVSPVPPDAKAPLQLLPDRTITNAEWAGPDPVTRSSASKPPQAMPTYAIDQWRIESGLPSTRVEALCHSPDGYLWVGTVSGLARFDGRRFTVFHPGNTDAMRETGDNIRALACDKDGQIWYAGTHGLARQRAGKFEALDLPILPHTGNIRVMTARSDGGVWIASDTGFWLCDGEGLRRLGPIVLTYSMAEDRQGHVAVSFGTATAILNPQTERWYEVFYNGPKIEMGGASESSVDESGNFLLGVQSGVFKVTGSPVEWALGPVIAGPLAPPGIETERLPLVRIAHSGGRLFVAGGPDDSISVWSEGQRLPPPTWNGRPLQGVVRLLSDRVGGIWVATASQGLLRLRPQTVVSSSVPAPAGFSTVSPSAAPPPTVLIEEVRANAQTVFASSERMPLGGVTNAASADPIVLPPGGTKSLEIRFAGSSLDDPDRVEVEYRLHGFETEWRQAGANRVASYANLKPRRYQFAVRAIDARGVRSVANATVEFVVQPYFWSTTPFYLICGAMAVAVVGSVRACRLRTQRRVRRLEQRPTLDPEGPSDRARDA